MHADVSCVYRTHLNPEILMVDARHSLSVRSFSPPNRVFEVGLVCARISPEDMFAESGFTCRPVYTWGIAQGEVLYIYILGYTG